MNDKQHKVPKSFEEWERNLMDNLHTMTDEQIQHIIDQLEKQNIYGGYDKLIEKLQLYIDLDNNEEGKS